ncbi:hypothetical protein AKG08_27775 [Achromobacter piechaudii]|nr:hypothetical protein AKG08_27775 [Achromobacter piechaudii]
MSCSDPQTTRYPLEDLQRTGNRGENLPVCTRVRRQRVWCLQRIKYVLLVQVDQFGMVSS